MSDKTCTTCGRVLDEDEDFCFDDFVCDECYSEDEDEE